MGWSIKVSNFLLLNSVINMERFMVLFLFLFQCIYITSGASLPDVRGSKLEEEIIKSRNPRVIGGVSSRIIIYFLIVYHNSYTVHQNKNIVTMI